MTGAQPADDSDIVNETVLWRRIGPEWYVWDENANEYRITSQAFQNYRGTSTMSVLIADECADTADALTGLRGMALPP